MTVAVYSEKSPAFRILVGLNVADKVGGTLRPHRIERRDFTRWFCYPFLLARGLLAHPRLSRREAATVPPHATSPAMFHCLMRAGFERSTFSFQNNFRTPLLAETPDCPDCPLCKLWAELSAPKRRTSGRK